MCNKKWSFCRYKYGIYPLGGIPMGTRSGDLDPSVVTYIAKYRNHTPEEMDEILNKKSGVYGISDVSVDFRDIEAEAADGDKNHKWLLKILHIMLHNSLLNMLFQWAE